MVPVVAYADAMSLCGCVDVVGLISEIAGANLDFVGDRGSLLCVDINYSDVGHARIFVVRCRISQPA